MAKQALAGKRLNAFAMDPSELTIIGLDTEEGDDHPLWDERIELPLMEPMILNIMAIGVKQSVTVRKDGDRVLVVDGRQRVRHAREANRRLLERGEPTVLVPARVEKGSDDLLDQIAVSLNEQRQQDSLIAKARRSKRMLDRNGDDYGAVAIAFGVTTQTIRNWQKLLDTSPKVQKYVEEGRLSPSAATQLSALSRKDQEAELDKITENGSKRATTARAARSARSKKNGKRSAPTKKALKKLVKRVGSGEELNIDEGILTGIRIAVGDLVPTEGSALAHILVECED